MKTQKLISVIVPIYGIDQYLGICIESLIKQTYKNLEIILVDDGSPDRCPEICDIYAKKDLRIHVIHKQNGGLVSARKAGLQAASGEYVGYVDGDDWVDTGFYETLYNAIHEANADLAISGHSRDLFDSCFSVLSNIPAGKYEGQRLIQLQQNMLSYGEFYKNGISTYVWNKLFVREQLLQYQNAVDNHITIGEDAAVVYPYSMACKRICIIDNCEYHYRQRADSMLKKSTSFQTEVDGLKRLYLHLLRFSEQYPEQYRLKEQVNDFILGICITRSGGVLNGSGEGHLPYDKEFRGKNIVVWNAGTFGQQLLNKIREDNCCNVSGIIDPDYWEYRRCCMDVDSIDEIENMVYDYILIATIDDEKASSIKSKLIWRGVEVQKIITVHCPIENRVQLLQCYLNL